MQQPGRLVNLAASGPESGSYSCGLGGSCDFVFSLPMFRDLEKVLPKAFTAIAAHRTFGANLGYERRAFSVTGLLVSGAYFPTLGIQPALGRLLTRADDERLGASPVAVLAHRFWERRLDSDSSAIGRTLMVNGQALTIVGVASPDFQGF